MFFELSQLSRPGEFVNGAASRLVPTAAALPPSLIFTERAVATMRAALIERDCGEYRIFRCLNFDLYDVDEHLDSLRESADWQPLGPSTPGGEPLSTVTVNETRTKLWKAGLLHLAKNRVLIARWLWCDRSDVFSLILCAAPSASDYERLRKRVLELRHNAEKSVWQVIGGNDDCGRTISRGPLAPGELILSPSLRAQIETEVTRFFSAEVAALYGRLRVPRRRGVLLYGPPGNGKTTLIRFIGTALPQIAGLLLRPSSSFDTDDLQSTISQWRQAAPAILVIEDLDWLLQRVNVSTFLNLLDGVDSTDGAGLLLIATTNHPEKLDGAINNRPGRFDAMIEMPCPQKQQRLEFLRAHLPDLVDPLLEEIVIRTEGLSFAHLQEILRLSGLIAINAARIDRADDDLRKATEMVRNRCIEAERGFTPKPEIPFGLGPLHEFRREGK